MPYKNSYEDIHDWLIRHFAKAKICEFCETKEAKRYEYALKKGRIHSKDRNCYLELCTSCHRRYDWNDKKSEQISERMRGEGNVMFGKKFSSEHLQNMSKSLKGKIPWNKGLKYKQK